MEKQEAAGAYTYKKSETKTLLEISKAQFNVADAPNNNGFVEKIARIHILAEKAIEFRDQNEPWKCRQELNKRREAYAFDNELQNLLCYLSPIGEYNAETICCGGSGMYRTELKDAQGHIFHVVNRTTGNDSKYRKNYFAMNTDVERPQYAYFQYTFDNEKQRVTSLSIIIPDAYGKPFRRFPINIERTRRKTYNIQNFISLSKTIEKEKSNCLLVAAQENAILDAN